MNEKKMVYVVTSGSYSDYGINVIFSTRELADEACALRNASRAYGDTWQIEEWPLDADVGSEWHTTFNCAMIAETGEIAKEDVSATWGKDFGRGSVRELTKTYYCKGLSFLATSYVSAKHAVKLAVEARQAWLRTQTETAK